MCNGQQQDERRKKMRDSCSSSRTKSEIKRGHTHSKDMTKLLSVTECGQCTQPPFIFDIYEERIYYYDAVV